MILAMIAALSVAQVPPPMPPLPIVGPTPSIDPAVFELLYHKFYWPNYVEPLRNTNSYPAADENTCFWAMYLEHFFRRIEDGFSNAAIADLVDDTKALNKLRDGIRKFISKNCRGPSGKEAVWKFGLSIVIHRQAKNPFPGGPLGDIGMDRQAEEIQRRFPDALPPCAGTVTTSGVCRPDTRLLIAAVIVMSLFMPGPDEAMTIPLIVRLARVTP